MTDLMITEKQVLEALSKVIDPDLHKDIVSLGFIEDLKIDDNGNVSFRIVLMIPAHPRKDQIRDQSHEYVSAIPGVGKVDITMDAREVKPKASMDAREVKPKATITPQNLLPNAGNIIAVASGKGGVGKSMVAANLAVALAKEGAVVALLDADIYGASIPMMMGVAGKSPTVTPEKKMIPIDAYGVKVMSIGFLVGPDQAIIWRGPMVGIALKQFIEDVDWGELDYLVVDLPPGTGDAQLTIVQNLAVTAGIIVTTPQKIAYSVAAKGARLFEKLNVPVLGIIENMSYFICPECGNEADIFGRGGGKNTAKRLGVPFLGEIPINSLLSKASDAGVPEVARDPESEISKCIFDVARNLAANISKHILSQ